MFFFNILICAICGALLFSFTSDYPDLHRFTTEYSEFRRGFAEYLSVSLCLFRGALLFSFTTDYADSHGFFLTTDYTDFRRFTTEYSEFHKGFAELLSVLICAIRGAFILSSQIMQILTDSCSPQIARIFTN